ncbi:potassium transport protein Kup [Planctomycetes bacterium Pan216]|uniref:Probable potassium transport system protein Kup n=1 Tax=Kolteria novifilia TaxID=2527975 RepID=A0A518B6B5_9BACT|nr:potassium transport protein Kup [Planctomycetes bacterium Pan216]
MSDAESERSRHSVTTAGAVALAVGALGVVYGDIGTSPLYALKSCFGRGTGIEPNSANVLGILSLIVWSLILEISVKYILLVMRADLSGEGGILALMNLVTSRRETGTWLHWLLFTLGLFGAALLYGDGMITPAMSVLSAIEGLKETTDKLDAYVVPITIAILVVLFAFQSRGTGVVGRLFGPVMFLWFLVISVMGICWIVREPSVLAAFDPRYGYTFLTTHRAAGFLILGSVFLVMTGGEALYADLGHFGVRPIRRAWFAVVFPSLLLNYFGQGALLINHPEAASHPFFAMAPGWAIYPLVVLATMAAVIASQAIISGAFSLTYQAVALGYLPFVSVKHYAEDAEGKVYVPFINSLLMVATIALVLAFQSSDAMAAAYGVAVSTTMIITTMLFYFFMVRRWRMHWLLAAPIALFFFVLDASFLTANLIKVEEGGWFPLVVGAAGFTLSMIWMNGITAVRKALGERSMTEAAFMTFVDNYDLPRPPGTAVYMASRSASLPRALSQNLQFNNALHEQIILLTVDFEEVPRIPARERVSVRFLRPDVIRVVARYGYMQNPNLPAALKLAEELGVSVDPETTNYYFASTTVVVFGHEYWGKWRRSIFAFLLRNSPRRYGDFRVPLERVFTIVLRVRI